MSATDAGGESDIQIEPIHPALSVDREQVGAFCRRWKIAELALFGSVVRNDFGPASDVDVMVRFAPRAGHDLWDFFDIQQELELLLGRPVDLMERGTIRNPFRRRAIERDLQVVYAAEQADAAYLWDMRELEIIGEAARRVSREFQEAPADLPWRQIIGQRNVLAHDYGEINPELVWNVARERLPELIRQLDAMVSEDPEDGDWACARIGNRPERALRHKDVLKA